MYYTFACLIGVVSSPEYIILSHDSIQGDILTQKHTLLYSTDSLALGITLRTTPLSSYIPASLIK